ncbi:MAG: diacylglycerol kinase family protein [Candidatus Promineifilaceae bacterium]
MRVLTILNPVAGRMKAGTVIDTLHRHFDPSRWQLDVYETVGGESVGDIVREAVESGVDRVFAAGGDGTVSQVVDGLALSSVPLGIIPTGTSNVVAQELGIPLNVEKACQLLAGNPATMAIDAMQVGDQFFILAVGTGIDAMVMESASRAGKRRFGPLAYAWTTLKVIIGMQPRRFTIIADGKAFQMKAAIVLLSNVGTLTRPLRWGPHIKPTDGRIDINIIRGKNILDYLLTAYDVLPGGPRRIAHIRHLQASESVKVFADQTLRVQGDGDLIGHTPLEALVIPAAVQVLVPPTD